MHDADVCSPHGADLKQFGFGGLRRMLTDKWLPWPQCSCCVSLYHEAQVEVMGQRENTEV